MPISSKPLRRFNETPHHRRGFLPGRVRILISAATFLLAALLLPGVAATNDGLVDTSFAIGTGAAGGTSALDLAAQGLVLAVTTDHQGRILVGGGFTNFNTIPCTGIVRLLASGAVDTSFQAGTGVELAASWTPAVLSILVTDAGNVLLGGRFSRFNGTPATNLVLLDSAGSAIETDAIANAPWRAALVTRFADSGTLDLSFTPLVLEELGFPTANAIVLQQDGNLLVGGNFYSADGSSYNGLCRVQNTVHPILLSPLITSNSLSFQVPTLAGTNYTLQSTPSADGVWQPALSFIGTGGLETHTAPLNASNAFYRLLRE